MAKMTMKRKIGLLALMVAAHSANSSAAKASVDGWASKVTTVYDTCGSCTCENRCCSMSWTGACSCYTC